MEFPFSSAVVSVHAHATEDEQRVLDLLKEILPASVEVRKSKTKGHHGNPILVFEGRSSQKKVIKDLWQQFLSNLRSGELDRLRLSAPERVDESCFFYMRFDKQVANGGELVLTDSGDAIHVRLKVVTFPARRELVLELVENFLRERGRHEAEAQIRSL